MPNSIARMVAQTASSSVAGIRSFNRLATGWRNWYETPNLNCIALPKYRANCTGTGSSRPRDFRTSARSAAEVSSETIWLTGSPAKRNIENEMIPTAIMTPIAGIARRRVKASMGSFHFFETGGRRCPPDNESPGSAKLPGLGYETFLFLFDHPVGQYRIIGALHNFQFFRNTPGQGLLMQRDIRVILGGDFERFLDQQIALGHIGLDQHLVGQRIHLLVAIAAEIGLAARGFRIVAAAHDVVENVL